MRAARPAPVESRTSRALQEMFKAHQLLNGEGGGPEQKGIDVREEKDADLQNSVAYTQRYLIAQAEEDNVI
jgi:hypothetical protein